MKRATLILALLGCALLLAPVAEAAVVAGGTIQPSHLTSGRWLGIENYHWGGHWFAPMPGDSTYPVMVLDTHSMAANIRVDTIAYASLMYMPVLWTADEQWSITILEYLDGYNSTNRVGLHYPDSAIARINSSVKCVVIERPVGDSATAVTISTLGYARPPKTPNEKGTP